MLCTVDVNMQVHKAGSFSAALNLCVCLSYDLNVRSNVSKLTSHNVATSTTVNGFCQGLLFGVKIH